MKPRRTRLRSFAASAALAFLALAANGCGRGRPTPGDPLATGIARWSAFVDADTARDRQSVGIRRVSAPVLAQARASLDRGRRLDALSRLEAAWGYLGALEYAREHASAGRSQEALEAEWKRAGPALLGAEREPVAGLRPAAVRALAEAELPDVRTSYEASLAYGRATDAAAGLFYLGEADAHRQFVELCRALDEPAAGREPPFRPIGPEIDTLQSRMLAVYRPPVSIDRHPEFIRASAALKEARALNAAGAVRGALLRTLQAALRFQPLRAAPPAFDAVATPESLRALASRLDEPGVDHSLGRMFLEAAQADLDDTSSTATHATAAAVAGVVLPLYFAALGPSPTSPPSPRPAPTVTVTLVRWPYT